MASSMRLQAVFLAFIVSGCTAQLTSNTLDMQESYKGVLMKQILYNLSQAMDDKNFFPSQFLIGAGTAETTNSITPSVSIPLPATTITNAVAAATNATINTATTAYPNAGLGLAVSDGWRFSWGATPRTDPDELRRLRALYLYGAGMTPRSCKNDDGELVTGEQACFKEQYVMQGGKRSVNQAFVDRPGCVLCAPRPGRLTRPLDTSNQANLEVNEKLVFGFITKSPDTNHRPFGTYGFTRFYVRIDGGEEAFADFVLFVLESMSATLGIPYAPPKPSPTTTNAAPAARHPLPPKTQFMQPFNFSLPL